MNNQAKLWSWTSSRGNVSQVGADKFEGYFNNIGARSMVGNISNIGPLKTSDLGINELLIYNPNCEMVGSVQ